MQVQHWLAVLLLAACAPDVPTTSSSSTSKAPNGVPLDAPRSRLASVIGDRLDIEGVAALTRGGRPGQGHGGPNHPGKGHPDGSPTPEEDGDWNYLVDGPVTGGVALFTDAWGSTASCADRLFVPTNSTGANVWAFDNLYPTLPGGTTACTNGGSDSGRCPSAYCPHRIWSRTLSGALDRSSLTLSLDGTAVYAATTSGSLYALDAATGATLWQLNTRTAAELGTGSGATFVGVAPWVDYPTGNIYVVASTSTRFRVYKISSTGAVLARFDGPTGQTVASSAIVWGGAIYFGTTSGRVYKILDGTTLSAAAGPWPVQLFAKGAQGNQLVDLQAPIYGTPSIDVDNDLLGLTVNNVMWTVKLATGAKQSVEGGWQNASEASANNVPCYSSPWLDPTTHTMFVAHGKDQDTPRAERARVHRREYGADGVFRTDNLNSAATAGVSNQGTLSDPRSSPLVLRQSASLAWVFVGDAGGFLNRWDYGTDFSNRQTFSTGSAIESPIMVDVLGGFIYFGSNAGRVYQIAQSTLR